MLQLHTIHRLEDAVIKLRHSQNGDNAGQMKEIVTGQRNFTQHPPRLNIHAAFGGMHATSRMDAQATAIQG
jgi:hypothetical protein